MFVTQPAVEIPRATYIPVFLGRNGFNSQDDDTEFVLSATELPPRARSSLTNDGVSADPDDEIDEWLNRAFGLEFDPFRHLNATEDFRLHEYLVDHELFGTLYQDSVSLVFAPAGGGKSAFRVRLARACRVGEGGRRLFPVVYLLPEGVITAAAEELWHTHEVAMLQAGTRELFLRLAYHPQEFSQLAPNDQQRVVALLIAWLRPSLDLALEQVADRESLEELAQGYDVTARWPNPPDEAALRSFSQALADAVLCSDQSTNPPVWADFVELVVKGLGFDAIYLLTDGVDAYPETFEQPHRTWDLLRPLFDRADTLRQRGVFIKAFLPVEMESSCQLTEGVTRDTIDWSHDSLRLLLQRRIEAASGMAPAGLNMLGDPGLFDLEERVIRAIRPTPRDALRFVERLFLEHVRRHGPSGRLNNADFQAALEWYSGPKSPAL